MKKRKEAYRIFRKKKKKNKEKNWGKYDDKYC